MTSWSQFQQIQTRNVDQIDTRNVTEGLCERAFLVKHNQWAEFLFEATVAHFTFTSTQVFAVGNTFQVVTGAQRSEKSHGLFGFVEVFDAVGRDDERHLRHLVDFVTASHHQRWHGRCSQRRHNGITTLVEVDFAVPFAPGFGRAEHATTAAHIAERTLTGARRTAARHTRDTRHSATCAPGFSRRLFACLWCHGIRLAIVFGDVGVNELHNIWANRCQQHFWDCDLFIGSFAVSRVNLNQWSCSSHLEKNEN
mmetsp:Transcript_4728/g.7597  ORF Transcript_4728/g.7597 Transcript_4728/m.7597 type:complete len:253 (+) Transcript_4728:472-1230(+)